MICLGVTGGIGSGKTTVCQILESLGAQVFYADLEAKRLMVEDPILRTKIKELLGEESYTQSQDGSWQLNREYVASKVFTQHPTKQKEQNKDIPSLLDRLNSLVHPAVQRAFEVAREKAKRENVSVLVFEAALLFESGSYQKMDSIWLVTAPLETRIRRVLEREKTTREAVLNRIQRQMPEKEMKKRSQWTLNNSQDKAHLQSLIQKQWDIMIKAMH